MKIVVIDGQGGKIGSAIVKKVSEEITNADIYAIGTNSLATASMLKSGAHFGATGENPVVRNAMDADVILGPIGIIVANAILGEVTPNMAEAVGSSKAKKIIVPVNSCNVAVMGVADRPLAAYIAEAADEIKKLM